MAARFEYHFVRLESGQVWATGASIPTREARESYEAVVHEHAADGWRLVQIFAPCLGANGISSYFELIFERELTALETKINDLGIQETSS